ncbi:hypothetical protein AB3U99_21700 [Niallia sp. JL1B1071]|uniref:hypothetical protein n=1 Tax=Niallia tiangongensis TaxID=3237105 RepID=UPI0037DD43C1
MNEKIDSMDLKVISMESRMDTIDTKMDSIETKLSSVEDIQLAFGVEQREIRKEVGFYYGSLMKKLDENKTELSSEIKQVSNIQKMHQDVLEY